MRSCPRRRFPVLSVLLDTILKGAPMKPADLHIRIWLLAIWLVVGGAGRAGAQVFPGRIVGTVTDSQGAVVLGADIKLSAPAIGLERKGTSDSNGNFRFVALPLDTFKLSISKGGLNTWVDTAFTTTEAT